MLFPRLVSGLKIKEQVTILHDAYIVVVSLLQPASDFTDQPCRFSLTKIAFGAKHV